MKNNIYISIKPKHIENIIKQIKNHEFRNYIPKEDFEFLIVYVTNPIKEIRYLIKINNIIEFPNKILYSGIGNKEFNEGQKTKYAYEILEVYELKEPFRLFELKKLYNFFAPQSFIYGNNYNNLTEIIINANKKLLWINNKIDKNNV